MRMEENSRLVYYFLEFVKRQVKCLAVLASLQLVCVESPDGSLCWIRIWWLFAGVLCMAEWFQAGSEWSYASFSVQRETRAPEWHFSKASESLASTPSWWRRWWEVVCYYSELDILKVASYGIVNGLVSVTDFSQIIVLSSRGPFFFSFFFLRFYLSFREMGRKRGRETSVGCFSHAPYWGPGP